jgi:alkylation response protein AidB-like acyl-CoA dehydrogenase
MDLRLTSEQIEFRQQARSWLSTNVPKESRPTGSQGAAAFDRAWQKRLHEGGWAGLNWPKEYGGAGLSGIQTLIWFEECERVGAPQYGLAGIALTHAGPTIIARGAEQHKTFHLPRILRGDSLWCQGFSEPGSGSDLASLRTRGVLDGDYMVVTGQKTWTSGARTADYQELLIRTDPTSKRHAGLTWIICDMQTPGIQIQPIKTMMGESEINSVFYDDVRIPLSNVLGEIGGGWSVALSTLAFERGTTFLRDQVSLSAKIERAIHLARCTRLPDGRWAIEDATIAARLAQMKAEGLAHRAMAVMSVSNVDRTGMPGPEGSMTKLLVSTTHKAVNELAAEILGLDFLNYDESRNSNPWVFDYMWGFVLGIAGGTTEIQREIIADRVLGLPRAR